MRLLPWKRCPVCGRLFWGWGYCWVFLDLPEHCSLKCAFGLITKWYDEARM